MKDIQKENLHEALNLLFNTNDNTSFTYISKSVNDTKKLGREFSCFLQICDVIVINGELGSGKTVFMQGLASYFGLENMVSSPTFTIVNEYRNETLPPIFHFDVYRIKSLDEFLMDIGTDYFYTGISIIEWGEIIEDILPENTIYIDILKDEKNENTRYFNIRRGK